MSNLYFNNVIWKLIEPVSPSVDSDGKQEGVHTTDILLKLATPIMDICRTMSLPGHLSNFLEVPSISQYFQVMALLRYYNTFTFRFLTRVFVCYTSLNQMLRFIYISKLININGKTSMIVNKKSNELIQITHIRQQYNMSFLFMCINKHPDVSLYPTLYK